MRNKRIALVAFPIVVIAGVALADGHPLPAPFLHALADLAHVVGVLPIANGGNNSGTALTGSGAIMVENGTAIVQGPAGTANGLLHGNAAGAPTYSAVDLASDVTGQLADANVSDTLTCSALVGSGSLTNAVDLATAEVSGQLPDANVSDTLTCSIFKGSGSTTDAIDLATAEVAGTLAIANVNTSTLATLAGANVFSNAANEFDGSVLLGEIAAPAASGANKAKCYVDSTSHTVKCSLNTGAYSDLLTALTGAKLSANTFTGIQNFGVSGQLSGSTTANIWDSNVTNTGGVDTAWRLNCSNLADNSDICISLFGAVLIRKDGSILIADGSSSAAGLAIGGSGTGFYKIASNDVGLTINTHLAAEWKAGSYTFYDSAGGADLQIDTDTAGIRTLLSSAAGGSQGAAISLISNFGASGMIEDRSAIQRVWSLADSLATGSRTALHDWWGEGLETVPVVATGTCSANALTVNPSSIVYTINTNNANCTLTVSLSSTLSPDGIQAQTVPIRLTVTAGTGTVTVLSTNFTATLPLACTTTGFTLGMSMLIAYDSVNRKYTYLGGCQ